MGFTAVCLSDSSCNQQGFDTYEAAEAYVGRHICSMCIEALDLGYYEYDIGDGMKDRYELHGPMSTSCGAEWIIIKDEEYDSADGLMDIFIASGMKPNDEKTEATLTPKQIAKLDQKQSKLRDEK